MSEPITLTALGDVAMVGGFAERFFNAPLIEVLDPALIERLRASDICLANIECVLTTSCDFQLPGYGLRTPPAAADTLKEMGVTIASLANNHIRDMGDVGVMDTIRHLNDQGIATCGAGVCAESAGKPLIVEQGGISLGILAVAEREDNLADDVRAGAATFEPERLPDEIRKLKGAVDVVILSVHAGHEFARVPSPRIRAAYRNAIRAGACCVLGHHPHVIQGIEWYQGAPIFYSLGNFCFDSEYVASYAGWDTGLIAELRINKTGVQDFQVCPVHIEPRRRITLLAGVEADAAHRNAESLSSLLKDEEAWKREWLRHVNWRYERDYLPTLKRLDSNFDGGQGSRLARLLRNYFRCPTHQELISDYFSARMLP